MNLVIQSLIERRNKAVPVNDGKKIALVLFGGLMHGVRGGASVIALEELGLTHAFDDIYGISAGFANASYFLAKQTREGTSLYYDDLKDRNFVNFFKIWKIVNIDFLTGLMRSDKVKKLLFERIFAQHTRLHARVRNVDLKKDAYLEAHEVGRESFMDLLAATISIPYLHPGSLKIGAYRYMDPNPLSKQTIIEHVQKVLDSDATDILVIFNSKEQYTEIKEANLKTEKNIFEIRPDESWRISKFCTDHDKLKEAASQMGKLVKNTFGVDEGIDLRYENRN